MALATPHPTRHRYTLGRPPPSPRGEDGGTDSSKGKTAGVLSVGTSAINNDATW